MLVECNYFAGTKIYEQTIIGNNCAIHSGSVIGADGFGFAQTDGTLKNPQIGM
jgi:UDP-3-O-[3-hydroxymyristoyl] glucosamine N-acyltransferase